MTVVFVSDGRPAIVGGVAAVLSGIAKVGCSDNETRVVVLSPTSIDHSVNRLLVAAYPEFSLSIHTYPIKLADDTYYLKFLLKKFIESGASSPDESIFYLDSDHLVLNTLRFPPRSLNQIVVSSEVKSIEIEERTFAHFNTSMIFADCQTLMSVVGVWHSVYFSLRDTVSHRYLEEVAFSVACKETGANLISAPISFQTGWNRKTAVSPILFHYGGISENAKRMKRDLASKMGSIQSSRELRKAGDEVARTHLRH